MSAGLIVKGAAGCYAAGTPAGQRDTDQGKTPLTGRLNRVREATNPVLRKNFIGFSVVRPIGRTSRLACSLGAASGQGKPCGLTVAYSTPGAAMFSALRRPAIHCHTFTPTLPDRAVAA